LKEKEKKIPSCTDAKYQDMIIISEECDIYAYCRNTGDICKSSGSERAKIHVYSLWNYQTHVRTAAKTIDLEYTIGNKRSSGKPFISTKSYAQGLHSGGQQKDVKKGED
jgi:hypothetical protein